MQIAILTFSVIALAISVILLWFELQSIKRTQRATFSMQLRQQFSDPDLQSAIARVRQIGEQMTARAYSNHQANGYHENGFAGNGHKPAQHAGNSVDQVQALHKVDQFFGYVGEKVRLGIADEAVFELMGTDINEMWYIMRPIRSRPAQADGVPAIDNFDYLYTEWLNWDYQHNHQVTQYQLPAPQSLSISSH
ncbi:MAG TPA: hypothetical protein VKB76_01585 [Ktedonobacterales bacterium]|nr:hypothetical protein [Ktedonobacterales bacterium]